METLNNWYAVCKSHLNFDLLFWMPHPYIARLQMNGYSVEPIFIGDVQKRRVMLGISKYPEGQYIFSNEEKFELGDCQKDFQKISLSENPLVYNWSIDKNLLIKGYLYKDGEFTQFTDEIIKQNMDTLTLKNNNEVFVVWNSMSNDQQSFLSSLSNEDRIKLCPEDFGLIKNCKMDLTLLIKRRDEREKRRKAFEAIDVPKISKNY